VTDKRKPDPWWEPARVSGETPSTLRSIEVAAVVSPDAESFEQEGFERPVYYEPQPLVAVSDHKTLEIDTIKLAQDIDPRKLPTELRLRPVSAAPLDSDWPQPDVVVVRSQPPSAGRRRWGAPVALLLLVGALATLALVLARAAAERWRASPPTVGVGVPTGARTAVAAAAVPSASSTVVAPQAAAEPSAEVAATTENEPPPSVTAPDVAQATPEKPPSTRGVAKPKPRRNSPTPNASSRALAAPSVSKPKRAIY
jgi:hypothetical protein